MRFVSRFLSLLVVVVVSLSFPSDAQVIPVGNLDGRIEIGGAIAIADSVKPGTSLDDVLRADSDVLFQPSVKHVYHSMGKAAEVWARAELVNDSPADMRGNLVIRFPYLQSVEVFLVDADGKVTKGHAGASVSLSGNALPGPFPAYEISIPAGQSRTLLVHARSNTVITLPIWLHSSADYQVWSQWSTATYTFLIGIIFTFTAFAWSIARRSRELSYRLYFWFCVVAIFYIVFSTGIGKAFLWPHSELNTLSLTYALQGAVMALGALFIAAFLDIRTHWPAFFMVIKGFVVIAVISCFYALLPGKISRLAYMVCTGLSPILVLAGVWVLHRRQIAGAGAVLMAWSPSLMATVWLYLRLFDITPYFEVNHYIVPIGLGLTVLQFSWAISNRVRETEANALTDALTGLPNRRQLYSTVSHRAPRDEPPCTAVLAIDLDGFKAINDTYGHDAGDAVLQTIAERLTKLSLGRAKAFRTGGDEFIVLYSELDGRADIQAFGEQCISRIHRPIPYGSKELRVGASVGIAFVQTLEEFKTGIHRADSALYHAKRAGKGTVRLFDERQAPIGHETFQPAIVES